MREGMTFLNKTLDLFFIVDDYAAFNLFKSLWMQMNIHDFNFTDVFLIFSEEKSQFGELDSQSQICMDNVIQLIVSIVLAHES